MPRKRTQKIIEAPTIYEHFLLRGKRYYFSLPNFTPNPQPLAYYLSEVCSYTDHPYFQTEIGRYFVNYTVLVVMEFWRRGFDSTSPCPFEFFGFKQREVRKLVQAESVLWLKTLALVERTITLTGIPRTPSTVFRDLIVERGLLLPQFQFREDPATGARQLLKGFQHQNREMLTDGGNLTNPFPADQYPTSHIMLDLAFSVAEKNDVFRREVYRPMVLARGKLIQVLLDQHPETLHLREDGSTITPVRRGPKNKSLKTSRGNGFRV